MPITYYRIKKAALSVDEMDENFRYLEDLASRALAGLEELRRVALVLRDVSVDKKRAYVEVEGIPGTLQDGQEKGKIDGQPQKPDLQKQSLALALDAADQDGRRGIQFCGVWAQGRAYLPDDLVTWAGCAYVCLRPQRGSPIEDLNCWHPLMRWNACGSWNARQTYLPGDLVHYDGRSYLCVTSNQGVACTHDRQKWRHFPLFEEVPLPDHPGPESPGQNEEEEEKLTVVKHD